MSDDHKIPPPMNANLRIDPKDRKISELEMRVKVLEDRVAALQEKSEIDYQFLRSSIRNMEGNL
jgi:hypothetical protein